MPVHDDLGTRMKTFYEQVPQTKLLRRTPVAIRIDGKAFHTFTKGFQRPFDEVLRNAMNETMKYLCENIQGCALGYCQSDEITLILIDYKTLNSEAWFDYEVQKLCSISASMATMTFNKYFGVYANTYALTNPCNHSQYTRKINTAMFDARCFNIPREEVTNLIYWRQLDAIRNSIQLVGQSYFSHRELQNKSCDDIQDMLMKVYNIDWNNYPTSFKRGACCIKTEDGWAIDTEIPIFKGEDRQYIEQLILPEEK